MTSRRAEALRVIAAFEALKGFAVIIAGFGLWQLMHHDIRHVAGQLVDFFHLVPGSHSSEFFLNTAERIDGMHATTVAAGAILYATVRFVEAYGLWRSRRWAEWFAAASGAIYIPFEIQHIHPGHWLVPAIALAINVAIVAFMIYSLRVQHRQRADG